MNDFTKELYHYGVLGMKWGVRRYQNPDGTRTAAGKKREHSKTLPKGTTMFRAVSNGSKNFLNRDYTYVNVTDSYADHSIATSQGFDGRFDTDYKLQTKRPLKIASADDYLEAVTKANGIDTQKYLKDIPNDVKKKGEYAVRNLLDNRLKEGDRTGGIENPFFKNALEYLRKHGYDGVTDPIDGLSDENPGMATVIFNPSDKIEIVDKY